MDYSHVKVDAFVPQNFDGEFIFTTDAPFNPDDPDDLSLHLSGGSGNPNIDLTNNIVALFVQDQWRVASEPDVERRPALGLRGPGLRQARLAELRAARSLRLGPDERRQDVGAGRLRHLLRPGLPERAAARHDLRAGPLQLPRRSCFRAIRIPLVAAAGISHLRCSAQHLDRSIRNDHDAVQERRQSRHPARARPDMAVSVGSRLRPRLPPAQHPRHQRAARRRATPTRT